MVFLLPLTMVSENVYKCYLEQQFPVYSTQFCTIEQGTILYLYIQHLPILFHSCETSYLTYRKIWYISIYDIKALTLVAETLNIFRIDKLISFFSPKCYLTSRITDFNSKRHKMIRIKSEERTSLIELNACQHGCSCQKWPMSFKQKYCTIIFTTHIYE